MSNYGGLICVFMSRVRAPIEKFCYGTHSVIKSSCLYSVHGRVYSVTRSG